VLGGDRQGGEDVLKTQEWGGSMVGVRTWTGGRDDAGGAHLAQPLFFLVKPMFKLDISQLERMYSLL